MTTTNDFLPIKIDFQQKIPLSEQITERLRLLIQAGVLRPGQPLPTVRQLAFQLRVNFNTVARAYRALDAEGLVITWQGRGSFVEQAQDTVETVEKKDLSAAQLLIDNLFKAAKEANIPEKQIWNALTQRQKGTSAGKISDKKKSPHQGNNKLIRRILGWKLTNQIVKRRIALHGTKQNVYRRVKRSKRNPEGVSRETSRTE